MMHDWKAFLQFTEERDHLALKVAELEAENAKYRKIGPTPEFLDGYVKALEAKVKAMMAQTQATPPPGFTPAGPATEGAWQYAIPMGAAAGEVTEGSDPGSAVTWPLLVNGKARTQRLRAYGDAIVVHQAVAWIEEVMAAIEHLKVQSEMRGGQ